MGARKEFVQRLRPRVELLCTSSQHEDARDDDVTLPRRHALSMGLATKHGRLLDGVGRDNGVWGKVRSSFS